jgi:hypothetical protein
MFGCRVAPRLTIRCPLPDNTEVGGPAGRQVIQEFLVIALVVTALLGGGMLLSDMKGFNFKLPSLEMLKKLLPQRVDDDADDLAPGFSAYADIDERPTIHPALLPSERAHATARAPSSAPALRVVHVEPEVIPELAPGTYDVHQPNLNRSDLEEPDPEIDSVLASLAEEVAIVPAVEPVVPEPPAEEAPAGDMDDLMSFFSDVAEVSRMPTTLTDELEKVSATDLLSEARELRALLTGRRDAA